MSAVAVDIQTVESEHAPHAPIITTLYDLISALNEPGSPDKEVVGTTETSGISATPDVCVSSPCFRTTWGSVPNQAE